MREHELNLTNYNYSWVLMDLLHSLWLFLYQGKESEICKRKGICIYIYYHVKLSKKRRIPFADLFFQETATGPESMEAQYFHLLCILTFHCYFCFRMKKSESFYMIYMIVRRVWWYLPPIFNTVNYHTIVLFDLAGWYCTCKVSH